MHIPRRPYRETLVGIPTIRVFEALASGIPLVSLPWSDTAHLFSAGSDYLVADTPAAMGERLLMWGDMPRAFSVAMGDEFYLSRTEDLARLEADIALIEETI